MTTLFFKTIAYDVSRKGFYSPSWREFLWTPEIVVAQCAKCAPTGDIGLDCTCGIYGSPNLETLEEYHKYPNSIVAIMNAYGRLDIWNGPLDLTKYYVLRCWGAKIVAILITDITTKYNITGQRAQSAVLAMDKFNVKGEQLYLAKEMLRQSWLKTADIDPFVPYKEEANEENV